MRLQRFALFTNGEGGAEQGVGSALPLAGTYEYPGREFLRLPPRARAVFREACLYAVNARMEAKQEIDSSSGAVTTRDPSNTGRFCTR